MDVYPTHTCFDDAFEYIELSIRQQFYTIPYMKENLFLAHGICQLGNGHRYAHAWIEDKGTNEVIFKGLIGAEKQAAYLTADKKDYYERFNVQETTLYSMREAADLNKATGHLGPYKDEYTKLCGKDKTLYDKNGNIVPV